MRTWLDVAVLTKVKNRNGRFAVRCTAGLPFLLQEGDEVALVPPRTDVPRRVIVSLAEENAETDGSHLSKQTCGGIVEFQDVNGALAREMAGMHCLIRRELVDESAYETSYGLWEGWSVEDDELGFVGKVSGLVENPAQSLIEVQRPDGSSAFVPAVDDIVYDVDVVCETVRTKLPHGLLDL